MATVQVQTKIPIENLLDGVEQLTSSDLEEFVSQVMRIQAQRKVSSLSFEESDLLQHINEGISSDTWEQYEELKRKREAEILSENEHQTLLQISNQIEEANAKRIELLSRLALIRKVSLDTLMTELEITSQGYE